MQYLPGFFRYRRLQISLQVFKRGKYFTAVSPYIENLYKKFTKKNNICVIPNGSETNLDVLPQKELNAKEPYLISINNGFDNRKNVHTLLKAFGIIHRIIPNAELHLFGVGYGIDEAAQKWANEQGLLNDKLYFEGFCRHDVVCEKLREADLLIHPSREESFGLIFLEAMQNGTPCIGGLNSGAVSWVLDEGNAGVLTDIESPNDIANSVMELLKNKEKWNNLRQYGFDYVKDKFDFDYVSECYLALYNSIVDKRELEV
jgi:glycosyltransferase involved in cell wall biosynthesis